MSLKEVPTPTSERLASSKQGKELKNFFSQRFPKSFQIDKKEISILREHTLEITASTEFPDSCSLVKKLAIGGGFDEALISPDTTALNVNTPFNSFAFPERSLEPLNDLLFSASPDFPREFATKGLKLIIEQLAQVKEGKVFKTVENAYVRREELINLYEESGRKKKKAYDLYVPGRDFPKKNETTEQMLGEFRETLKYIKEREAHEELEMLAQQLPTKARAQFVEKVKKEGRDVVEEIATVETLSDLLGVGVMNGLNMEEKKVKAYLEELYPDPVLDKDTRSAIIKKSNEIRKKLKEAY